MSLQALQQARAVAVALPLALPLQAAQQARTPERTRRQQRPPTEAWTTTAPLRLQTMHPLAVLQQQRLKLTVSDSLWKLSQPCLTCLRHSLASLLGCSASSRTPRQLQQQLQVLQALKEQVLALVA